MRYTPCFPERQGQDFALQSVSPAETEDTGVFAAERGSLSYKVNTYAGGVPECKNDCKSASSE